ncbi:hypothetical protein [Nocardioides sp.]|uniref:hypothetical protein n=1 Tax=Nocardioides sp. TaxID=35761 RepID=UPI00261C7B88|nr:hypothetical protein [Nocardioides sp.]
MLTARPTFHPHLATGLGLGVIAAAAGLWCAPTLAARSDPKPAIPNAADVSRVGDGKLPAARPALRASRAPLSVGERGYAVHKALAALPAGAHDVLGAPGAEVLLAEVSSDQPSAPATTTSDASPPSPHRLVTVVTYDYAHATTTQATVDLTLDRITWSQTSTTAQWPPSSSEVAVALDLAVHSDLPLVFHQQFARLTGSALTAASQLSASALVWADATPAGLPEQADSPCGQGRCLRLLIGLPGGGYLSTQDFAVDLTARRIVMVEGQSR